MNIFIILYFNIYARNIKKIPLITPNDMMLCKVLFANTAHSRMVKVKVIPQQAEVAQGVPVG